MNDLDEVKKLLKSIKRVGIYISGILTILLSYFAKDDIRRLFPREFPAQNIVMGTFFFGTFVVVILLVFIFLKKEEK